MSEYLLLHTRLGYSDSNSIIIAANVTNRRAGHDTDHTPSQIAILGDWF